MVEEGGAVIEEAVLILPVSAGGVDPVTIPLVKIPPGQFSMGSPLGLPFAPEGPVHQADLSCSFMMGRFPVTQEQYITVMGKNPSEYTEYIAPVETVSWDDAKLFCERLSAIIGYHTRLPTETEWEYACRAGTSTQYYFGDDAKMLSEYAWFELNSDERAHPVGLKRPNAWGLFDMVGNVWEWCEDVWHGDYTGAPEDGTAWMTNQEWQDRRVVRGAAWNMDAFRCRCSYRSYDHKGTATDQLGFRIVVDTVLLP